MKNTVNEIFTSLEALVSHPKQKIVVVTHENPDGDAIGSAIGLGEVLKNVGHDVKIIVPNDYPAFLQWFSSELEILIYERKKNRCKTILQDAQVLFCLDFNEPKRTARMERAILEFSNQKVLIDHHPYPSDFCNLMISEPGYSSTAELVFDVVSRINLSGYVNHDAAEGLFTGIMTDTGCFSHNISRPNTFQVVAKLMEAGIDSEKIHAAVYHNFSAQRMQLLGHCLAEKMQVFPEYRAAVIWLSQKELQEYKFQPGDTEGFVNYPLSINNIVFSALFIEKKDYVKASFRSKGSFPVNEFSREHFSGGGHRNAAGGETKISLDESVEKFKQLLSDYKHQLLETTI
ncbi:DHH family phosphoesterase [Mariniphaga anaerophila]|uniref:DHH family phosphoesterase n=1 Tax=Mariniphaga anaerophila TaxID=1484053 RepID=UPI001587F576|nr:bifunctional oligoribonuclease/PAP phosphatase NrnA [Mariniphaga anaerophila]